MKKITIKINGEKIRCNADKTIYQAAKDNNIFIPGLCNHSDFPPKANCRICVVEIKGQKNLVTSCSTLVQEGMEISTKSDRVRKVRNLNIELIFAEHIEKCADCVWRFECSLLSFAEKYKILITRFRDRKKSRKIYKFANAVELDGSQCIDCRNCIDACSLLQNINYLKLKGKGTDQEVVPEQKKGAYCILCGQCALHCPVSAAQEQSHWEMVKKELKNKKKITIAQFAPSIRVSIGEDFGLPYGKIMTGQIVAGLRALGFNYVFDVNFGADVTTIVEAEELLERLKTSPSVPPLIRGGRQRAGLPMFTSCCPAWVNYVEFYHPELIPNLTTARSPHIHNAGIIKTYWARKMNINPKNIILVSIMPCTAKKYEAARSELKINGNWPVDYVLTTREFSFMLKNNRINLAKLEKSQADNPFGEHSGAAAIYGASGGVIESALRSAQYFACLPEKSVRASGDSKSKICRARLEFNKVRGLDGIKETFVKIDDKKLRVAVVNGIGNINPILENIKRYDYVEVMACPGGCIGGGGQPIPTTPEIRKRRMEALYKIDAGKKIRKAHENEEVMKVLIWLKRQDLLAHQVLHTTYKKKIKY